MENGEEQLWFGELVSESTTEGLVKVGRRTISARGLTADVLFAHLDEHRRFPTRMGGLECPPKCLARAIDSTGHASNIAKVRHGIARTSKRLLEQRKGFILREYAKGGRGSGSRGQIVSLKLIPPNSGTLRDEDVVRAKAQLERMEKYERLTADLRQRALAILGIA